MEPFPHVLECDGPSDIASIVVEQNTEAVGYFLGPAMRRAIFDDMAQFGVTVDADQIVAWGWPGADRVPMHFFKNGCHVHAAVVPLDRLRPVGERA